MGLNVLDAPVYAVSLRRLFPQGRFWDEQFADPGSDLSLWCAARSAELVRFKTRRAELLEEGFIATTLELIGNWEALAGLDNSSLDLESRHAALEALTRGSLNRGDLNAAAAEYGGTLDDVKFPFRPAVFGRSRFRSRMSTPAAFSSIWLYITLPDMGNRTDLETRLTAILLANHIPIFLYKDEDDEYVP